MKKKYYIITVQNIFEENSKKKDVRVVEYKGEFIEILTGKKICMSDKFKKDDFFKNGYSFIGIVKFETTSKNIETYLQFMTESLKREILSDLFVIEESIKNSLNFNNLESSKKLKLIKND